MSRDEYIEYLEGQQAKDPDPLVNLILEELYQEREQQVDLYHFKAGDLMTIGTSELVYEVVKDETKTGIVNCIRGDRKYRFNSNRDALNLHKEED